MFTLELVLTKDGQEVHRQTVVLPESAKQAELCASAGPAPRDRGLVPCIICNVPQADDAYRYPSKSGKRSKSCSDCRSNNRAAILSTGATKGHVTRKQGPPPSHVDEWRQVKKIASEVLASESAPPAESQPEELPTHTPDGLVIKRLPPACTEF